MQTAPGQDIHVSALNDAQAPREPLSEGEGGGDGRRVFAAKIALPILCVCICMMFGFDVVAVIIIKIIK